MRHLEGSASIHPKRHRGPGSTQQPCSEAAAKRLFSTFVWLLVRGTIQSIAALSDEMVIRMWQIHTNTVARPFIEPGERGMAMVLAWWPSTVSPLGARWVLRPSREARYGFVPRVLLLASTHQARGEPSLGPTP